MSTGKKDPVVPAVVLELIEESETIQGWMDRLDDNSDEAFPEVLERVREDYRGRLGGVAGDLAEHRPDLASSLEDRRRAVVSLEADQRSQTADLEEARLRRAVGEFTETEWDARRAKIEGALDRVAGELNEEEDAVAELAAVLKKLDGIDAATPSRSTVVFGSEGAVEVGRKARPAADLSGWRSAVASTGATAGGPRRPARVAEPRENGSADRDELDFLDAVSTDDLDAFDPLAVALRERES